MYGAAAVNAGAFLHHIELQSRQPAKLARFYAETMDMKATDLGEGCWICEGPLRRVLFAPGENRALGMAGFGCRDHAGLDAIRSQAEASGVTIESSGSPLFGEGAFQVRDPDGNKISFGLGLPEQRRAGLRAPLQHLTLATSNPEAIEAFYQETLGFLVSDRVLGRQGELNTVFTRSNHEHHTLACFRHPSGSGIDHHSYEAGDWATIQRWCDRMGELQIPLMWGPGRHGPGNNIFVFIEDPDANWIEISAELEVIYDRPVMDWPHEERTLNLWGRGILRVPGGVA